MTAQIDILYAKDFGHVLAAFTRAAEPDQIEAAPTAFVGAGLVLRGLGSPANYAVLADFSTLEFVVPAASVALARIDLNSGQLAAPRTQYFVDPSKPTAVTTFPNTTPTIAPAGSPPVLTITLASPVAADTKFLLSIHGQALPAPLELPCIFPSGTWVFSPNLPIISTLAPGTYYAVAMIPAYPVAVQHFSV